jgi:hypothetical protein
MTGPPGGSAGDMPDAITYAVLTMDGELLLEEAPSRPEFREDTLSHNGPWDAAIQAIGGPCRSVARTSIGNGHMAWVADESLLRPADYPQNVIGGKTVNILAGFAEQAWRGLQEPAVELNDRWAGPIVITQTEHLGHDRWCGFIWPLDEEQEWLIREAWRAATGDDSSSLYTDDLDVDEEDE